MSLVITVSSMFSKTPRSAPGASWKGCNPPWRYDVKRHRAREPEFHRQEVVNQLEVSRVFPDEVDLIYAQGGDSVALMQTARQVEQVNVGFQRIRRQVERIRQLRTKLSQEHRLPCSPRAKDGDEGPPFRLHKPLPHEAALLQPPHRLDRPGVQLKDPIKIHVVRLVLKVSFRQTICRNDKHFG